MNVFVLSPGRCGSVTMAYACRHATNFRAGHETNCRLLGGQRFGYPPNFIEIDNRLSWMLGRLERAYGDTAWYVQLTRDPEAIAQSYNKRWHIATGIIPAYRTGILMNPQAKPIDICRDYVETVTTNIAEYLKDKTHVLPMALETMEADFARFWDWIGATGDKNAALAEFKVIRNANVE
jgi:hypothetical protein